MLFIRDIKQIFGKGIILLGCCIIMDIVDFGFEYIYIFR
jgi:hypothetical protein